MNVARTWSGIRDGTMLMLRRLDLSNPGFWVSTLRRDQEVEFAQDVSEVQRSVSYRLSPSSGSNSLFPVALTLTIIIATRLASQIFRLLRPSPHSFKHNPLKEANKRAHYHHLHRAEKINGHS